MIAQFISLVVVTMSVHFIVILLAAAAVLACREKLTSTFKQKYKKTIFV